MTARAREPINWRSSVDALGRKRDADFLTNLFKGRFRRDVAKAGTSSLVLNIDAPWGTGKTFLLDHWSEDLEESGWTVLRFNAWAHDYATDPLLNFIASIDTQLAEKRDKPAAFTEAAKSLSGSLKRNLAPAVAKSVFKAGANLLAPGLGNLLDIADTESMVEDASDGVEKLAERMVAQEKAIAQRLEQFKSSLMAFAGEAGKCGSEQRPIVLLIDELDRCRPNFAIDLLEVLKHVFAVPGVYTVVATDTEQLTHSARHAYGANFASGEYLKRFFDLQYKLPASDRQHFAVHLLQAEGLLEDALFLCPIDSVLNNHEPSASLYVPLAQAGAADRKAKTRAARALFIAAIADRLGMQNREIARTVQLIRAVADSFVGATQNQLPEPKLHFVYLALLSAAFVKDDRALASDGESLQLFEKSRRSEQARDLPSGWRERREVSTLFNEFASDRKQLAQRDYGNDELGQEQAQLIINDPASARHLAEYPNLVRRCGHLSDK